MLVVYLLTRLFTLPFAYLPYKTIHQLGKSLGTLAYYLIPKYRKRAESNLANAKELTLTGHDIRRIAKESIQSLMITCLEYPKLALEKDISKIATSVNPEKANALMNEGKGVIFFCGHQANWELLFLEGTSRMKGVAIGRPIKNKYLYKWVQSMRQKFGGTIITPKNAIKEGLRALKSGAFLGVVGDQGLPESPYYGPFLGRKAYTSPIPALLSYKTGAPIIVATTTRKNGHYYIHYSEPIFPNKAAPREEEVSRLMDATLSHFAKSIKKRPGQWLWIHNRWKQQTLEKLKKPYRQDSIAIFATEEKLQDLSKLRELYPTEEITIFVPKALKEKIALSANIKLYPTTPEDVLKYKLIFNLTKDKSLTKPYKKHAVTIADVANMDELETLVKNA